MSNFAGKNNRDNGHRDAPINIEPWEWITLEWVESIWKFGEAMGCKRVALFIMKSKRKKKKRKRAHKVELAEIQENNSQWDLGRTTISNPFSDCVKSRIHGRHFDTI